MRAFLLEYFLSHCDTAEQAMERGYFLLFACQQHADDCPLIQAFWKTVQGDVTDGTLMHFLHFSQDLDAVLLELQHSSRIYALLARRYDFWITGTVEMDIGHVRGVMQLFSPSRLPAEILQFFEKLQAKPSISLEGQREMIDEIRVWTLRSFLQMCETCLVTLFRHLEQKSTQSFPEKQRVIPVEELKSIILTEYLENPDHILQSIMAQCRRSFPEENEQFPLSFVKDVIRCHVTLRWPEFQQTKQALEYCTWIQKHSSTTAVESTKAMPDMA